MSETAYNNWIHQQLEPTDIIRGGSYKKPKSKDEIFWQSQIEYQSKLTHDEQEALEDAYLRSKGIY